MRRRMLVCLPTLCAVMACNGDKAPKAAGPPAIASVAPDMDAIASSLVNRSLGVKPGDRVIISGSPRDLELFEDVVTQVSKAGGLPLPVLETERMARRSYDEVPAQFDSIKPEWTRILSENATSAIYLDVAETPDLLAHVPAARIAARNKAVADYALIPIRRKSPQLSVGNDFYPTHARAARFGMSRDQLAAVYWHALAADFTDIRNNAASLKDAIGNAKELHITDANGTDFRVQIAHRHWLVSDGVFTPEAVKAGDNFKYLPAGELYTRIDPGTAEGTIVIDKVPFQSSAIPNVKLVISKGELKSMTSSADLSAFRRAYDAELSPLKSQVTIVDFGLNPAVHASDGSSFRTWVPEGMVNIGIGNDTWAGGTNNSQASMAFFLASATVTADGKVIVENGKLKK